MRNESPNVERLFRELTASLTPFGRAYEIIAIDDGSPDDTFQLLAAVQARDPRVRVIVSVAISARRQALPLGSPPRAAATSSPPMATCRTIRPTSPG